MPNDLKKIYEILLNVYGKQGWWPINHNFNPKEFEICIGAILTQNTNWNNVEKSLDSLEKASCTSPIDIASASNKSLQKYIRSSGFHKIKSKSIRALSRLILNYKEFIDFTNEINRESLLSLNGIGKETADAILLYVCNKPYFVVDRYTMLFCDILGLKLNKKYEDHQNFFQENLPKNVEIYKEFHALIVASGKDKFSKIHDIKY